MMKQVIPKVSGCFAAVYDDHSVGSLFYHYGKLNLTCDQLNLKRFSDRKIFDICRTFAQCDDLVPYFEAKEISSR